MNTLSPRARQPQGHRPGRLLAISPNCISGGLATSGRQWRRSADSALTDKAAQTVGGLRALAVRDLAGRVRQPPRHRRVHRHDRPAAAVHRRAGSLARRRDPALRRNGRARRARAAGHGRVLEPHRRDRQGDDARRLLPHRRHRGAPARRDGADRRPDQGHDPGLGLQTSIRTRWRTCSPPIRRCSRPPSSACRTAIPARRPAAYIVKADESLTAEEVRAWCKENLTGYKVPRHIHFREALPKTKRRQDAPPRAARRGDGGAARAGEGAGSHRSTGSPLGTLSGMPSRPAIAASSVRLSRKADQRRDLAVGQRAARKPRRPPIAAVSIGSASAARSGFAGSKRRQGDLRRVGGETGGRVAVIREEGGEVRMPAGP